MANLNLSEFTEKLFVADADHTFIWDSAMSISKRVSRNSWLNSGTLTSDAPVTISQTWNGTGSTVFKALVVNATTLGTTSSGDSLVADFQVGGVSQLRVHKSGGIGLNNLMAIGGISGPWFMVYNGSTPSGYAFGVNTAGRLSLPNTGTLEWASFASGTPNTVLLRDGADNTLALRNGALPQTFNIYNTYQNTGVDYERIAFKWSANLFTIGREFGGTGGARNINIIGGGSVLGIGSAATAAVSWTFSSNHFLAGTDNLYDIGASGANRPRNVYVGSNVISRPAASITPANNGEFVVEATSNTTLTFKLKGTDGTVRTGTITLA